MLAALCGMEAAYVLRGSDLVHHLQNLCRLEPFLQGRRSRCYSVSSTLVHWLVIFGIGLLVNLSPDGGALAAMAPATDGATVTGTAHHVPSCTPIIGSPVVQSAEELRRTIEESVLNKIVSSIREHHEKVDKGERRPRPFVTLTYAQSIDGSIAAADRSQVMVLYFEIITKVTIYGSFKSPQWNHHFRSAFPSVENSKFKPQQTFSFSEIRVENPQRKRHIFAHGSTSGVSRTPRLFSTSPLRSVMGTFFWKHSFMTPSPPQPRSW